MRTKTKELIALVSLIIAWGILMNVLGLNFL